MQNCADGRFQRAETLPAIRRVACATQRGQRSELSQRRSGALLVQGPSVVTGPAPAAGAMGGTGATPAPTPTPPGKRPSGFGRTHFRLRADPDPRPLQGRRHTGRYVTRGSATGLRLFADCSIASVTSSVRRASRAV